MSNAVVQDWPSGSANAGWPQEPTAMLMPGRVQGWPAGTQRAANSAQRLLSQAVAWWDVEQYRDGDRFLRNRGVAGELLDLRLGSSIVANSNDPQYLAPEDIGYVYLAGVVGNYLSAAPTRLTSLSSLELAVRVSFDSLGSIQYVAGWGGGHASLRILANNTLSIRIFNTPAFAEIGSAASSAAVPGIAAGVPVWLRAKLTVATAACEYWYSFDATNDISAVTWTVLGTTQTGAGAGTTPALNLSNSVLFGARSATEVGMAGRLYAGRETVDGTARVEVNCDDITTGSQTSWEGVYQTVTVNRSTSGRKSVAMPSRHKGGKPVMLLGTDDFLAIPDENGWQHGLLNFKQGDSFTVLAIIRQWATPTSSGTYVTKRGSGGAGWMLTSSSTTLASRVFVEDTSGLFLAAVSSTTSAGTVSVYSGVIRRTDKTMAGFIGQTSGTPTNIVNLASLQNAVAVNIGRNAAGAAYQDFEFYGAAIVRGILSSAQLQLLANDATGRIA